MIGRRSLSTYCATNPIADDSLVVLGYLHKLHSLCLGDRVCVLCWGIQLTAKVSSKDRQWNIYNHVYITDINKWIVYILITSLFVIEIVGGTHWRMRIWFSCMFSQLWSSFLLKLNNNSYPFYPLIITFPFLKHPKNIFIHFSLKFYSSSKSLLKSDFIFILLKMNVYFDFQSILCLSEVVLAWFPGVTILLALALQKSVNAQLPTANGNICVHFLLMIFVNYLPHQPVMDLEVTWIIALRGQKLYLVSVWRPLR